MRVDNTEGLFLLESKLHYLSSLELFKGLTAEEKAIQEELYQEYIKVREKEWRRDEESGNIC